MSVTCSVMSDSVTPWTVAHQAPRSMGSSRQEDWSGSPFPIAQPPERHPGNLSRKKRRLKTAGGGVPFIYELNVSG